MKKKILFASLILCCLMFLSIGCSVDLDYQVVFMNGEERYFWETVKENESVTGPSENPTKAEDENYTYTFKGWSLQENGEVVEALETKVTKDLTYYAIYEKHEKKVYYDVYFINGVTNEVFDEQRVLAGEDARLPEPPVNAGYTFKEWKGDYTNISRSTEITAVYTKNKNTLTFVWLGEEEVATYEHGADLSDLPEPTVPQGLIFEGWYADESYETLLSEKYPDGMPDAAVTAYAKFAVDVSGIQLTLPEICVYGSSVSVKVPDYAGIEYSYSWQDGSKAEIYSFPHAGNQTVTVTVFAKYSYDGGAVEGTCELQKEVNVQKADLTVTANLQSETVVYGTDPNVNFGFVGFVGQDEGKYTDSVLPVFMQGEDPFEGRLAVGTYSVAAKYPEALLSDYNVALQAGNVTVTQKPLQIGIKENTKIIYGNTLSLSDILFNGFIDGENQEDLVSDNVHFIYKKGGVEYNEVLTVGDYTAVVDGYSSVNYEISFVEGAFKVEKAELVLSARFASTEYTYPDMPNPEFDLTGFVYEDTAETSVTGNGTVIYHDAQGETAEGVLSVGHYTAEVSANEMNAENYNIVSDGQETEFDVLPRTIVFTYENTNLTIGNSWYIPSSTFEWSIPVSAFTIKDLPKDYSVGGNVRFFVAEAGTYTWTKNPDAFTLEDLTVTAAGSEENLKDNFLLQYDVTLAFQYSDFSVTIPEVQQPYTGKPIGLGEVTVENEVAGTTIEYSADGKIYSKEPLTGVDANDYTVYFRVSAPGLNTYEGSYVAKITQAENKIQKIQDFETYQYNGTEQTVEFSEQLKADFGEIVVKEGYSNKFTDVPKDLSLTFVVCVEETSNYAYAEYSVTVTVNKANYTVEQIPEEKLADSVIYRRNGKKLSEVALKEGFDWAEEGDPLLGTGGEFDAKYLLDKTNYNAYPLTIKVEPIKQKVTVTVNNLDADFGIQSFDFYSGLEFVAEDGKPIPKEDIELFIFAETEGVNFLVGGTYIVTYDGKENDYYVAQFDSEKRDVWFKLKSVDVGGTLYTIEDALMTASQGMITVKHDTSFAAPEVKNTFSAEGLYVGDAYYEVKSSVTLLLPYSSEDTTGNNSYNDNTTIDLSGINVSETAYVTLSIVEGINVYNFGTIIVGAYTGSKTPGGAQPSGYITLSYSEIILDGILNVGSEQVKSGTISAYGNIKGAGTLNAYDGSVIRERMEIPDWQGASASAGRFMGNKSESAFTFLGSGEFDPGEGNIFPFHEYRLNAIQLCLNVYYGAKYNGMVRIFTNKQEKAFIVINARFNDVDFCFVGRNERDNALIQLSTEISCLTKVIREGKTYIEVSGGAVGGIAKLSFAVLKKTFVMNSSYVVFPVDKTIDITLKDGIYSSRYSYKFMPGSKLTVGDNATLTLDGEISLYTTEHMNNGSIGDAVIEICSNGKMVLNGTFGGVITGKAGANVSTGVNFVSCVEILEGAGSMSLDGFNIAFGFTPTLQTSVMAQLLHNEGVQDMAAGNTYIYGDSGWAVSA